MSLEDDRNELAAVIERLKLGGTQAECNALRQRIAYLEDLLARAARSLKDGDWPV